MANEQYYCKKCNRTMAAEQFYGSNNLEKYPEAKLDTCKKCITMHVNNWEPETYLWILQECDVPYVPDEWNKLLESYARNPEKLTGMTILGRYLSKMKLKQWKEYRWKDTAFLQELADNKLEQAMKRQGYGAAEITVALEKNKVVVPEGELVEPQYAAPAQEDYFADQYGGDDFDIDLTEEDKTYLRLKWGKTYRPEEWVKLEQLYEEMMASYDVQGAGHIDTLKLLCKTSLKANQLIDMGDVEGFQKMSKVYDSLMKSGKFTAQQNKEDGEFVDAIGQLVEICEKEGFIPRYYIDKPNDRVDETLADMKGYTKTLVYEELNLGNLIEQSIKTMLNEENKEEDEDIEEEIMTLEEVDQLKDEDFEQHADFLEEMQELDEEYMRSIIGDEE